MGQFFYNVSCHQDRRPHHPCNNENHRPLCTVAIGPNPDWPVDLFMQNKGSVLKPPERPKTEFHCACGCQQRHNCAVSRVVSINGDRQVLWYRTIRCLNKHARIVSETFIKRLEATGDV